MNFIKFWVSLFSPISFSFGGGGGGGPSSTQSTGTTYNTNIPDYAQPYVENMLGATQKQLFNLDDSNQITGFKPYQAYSTNADDYVAGFSPMQQQAMRDTANLRVPSQYGQASMGTLGLSGQMAGAGQQYAMGATDPRTTQAYMSPYQQNVTDYQKAQALRDYQIGQPMMQAKAVGQGAFGGNRLAIQQAEAQRGLMSQLQGIEATGAQNAFQNAQQQQQYAANLGLQGQQGALQGLNQYGQLGGQQLAAQQGIIQSQYGMGQQQQAAEQQKINQAIQDWSNTQQYPLMQLGVMSNMLRGLPMQASTTNQYVAAPNALTQGIGAAGAGASLYNALKGGKEGGLPKEFKSTGIKSYYEGELIESTKSDLYDLPLDELDKRAKTSTSPTIKRLAGAIAKEKRMGLAGGGIVAFAGGETVKEDPAAVAKAYRDAAVMNSFNQEPKPYVDRSIVAAAPTQAPVAEAPVERADPAAVSKAYVDAAKIKQNEIPEKLLYNPEQLAAKDQLIKDVGSQLNRTPVATSPGAGGAGITEDVLKRIAARDYRGIAGETPVNPASIAAAAPADKPTEAAPSKATEAAPSKAAAPAAAPAENKGVGIKPNTGIVPNIGGIKGPTNLPAGLGEPPADPYANKSISELAAEKIAYLGPDVRKEERAGLMAERANSKDEARRAQSLRMAEFFAAWGSTPGSTITAGLSALKSKLPDIIADSREEAKIRRAINKDIAALDKADRLEKSGAWDEAAKIKQEQSKNAYNIWGKKVDYLSARESDASRERSAATTASARGGSDSLTKLLAAQTAKTDEIRKIQKDNDSLVRDANMPNPNNSPAITKIKDDAQAKLNKLVEEPQRQLNQINQLVDAHGKIQALNDTGKIAAPTTVSDTVTSGGKTYSRSDYPKMTDAQWAQYQEAAKKASGAK